MATVLSTCYPPVMASTFADTIVNTENAKVYFSLSSFNSATSIYRVHVSVVNQQTNENVLKETTGILVREDLSTLRDEGDEDGLYHVTINTSELAVETSGETGAWNTNMYYAVQLRFDTNPQTSTYDNAYFSSNTEYFSEWSEVCLIRTIPQPTLIMRPWQSSSTEDPTKQDFVNGVTTISGKLIFEGQSTDYKSYLSNYELLQSYRVKVLDEEDDDEVLFTSSRVYTTKNIDQNSITYNLDLANVDLDDRTTFRVRVEYTTKNQYTSYADFPCGTTEYIEDTDFSPTIDVSLDDENGIATINIVNTRGLKGTLYVKRSSSLSNFKTWETIREEDVVGTVNLTIKDNTVGSGVWYQYYVQFKRKASSTPSEMVKSKVIFPSFYNAIISREDKQFAIKYNYTISSMKPVVSRQKVDTLGGQYPKFAENAVINYKQFSISGLISTQEDEAELFLGKKEFYGNRYNDYTAFEDEEYRDEYTKENYNFFWEREFREELVKWLNDGEPKLYRSMTEGTMVVMITDVSLTPNATLSRRLFTFSATVYEIADGSSLETLDSLGIYTVETPEVKIESGDDDDDPTVENVSFSIPGQLYDYTSTANDINVVSTIASSVGNRYLGARQNKKVVDGTSYLSAIKIHFTSEPHLFYQSGNSLLLVEEVKTNGEVTGLKTLNGTLIATDRMFGEEESKGYSGLMRGYSFTASSDVITNPSKGSTFFVNESGYYQIPSYSPIKSLFFEQVGDQVTMEYVITYEEEDSGLTTDGGTAGEIISSSIEKRIVGQECGYFAADSYIAETINKKYTQVSEQVDTSVNKFAYRVDWWRGICVDVDPFSVISIKYRNDTAYQSYTVGFNGVLHLLRDLPVEDMCFLGRETRLLDEDPENASFCEDYECIDSGITVQSTRKIKNPVIHLIYHVGDKDYLYYIDGQFYERDATTGIAKVPVYGILSYYANVYKDIYEMTY